MNIMPQPLKAVRKPDHIIAVYLSLRCTTADELIHDRNKGAALSRARQELMWLLRDLTHLTLAEIGQHVGGRDETTVRHGIDRVSDLIASDGGYRQQLQAVRRAIFEAKAGAGMTPDLCLTAVRSVLANDALTDADARKAALQLMETRHG